MSWYCQRPLRGCGRRARLGGADRRAAQRQVGRDVAGGDRVHAQAERRPLLDRLRAHQADDAVLGRAVRCRCRALRRRPGHRRIAHTIAPPTVASNIARARGRAVNAEVRFEATDGQLVDRQLARARARSCRRSGSRSRACRARAPLRARRRASRQQFARSCTHALAATRPSSSISAARRRRSRWHERRPRRCASSRPLHAHPRLAPDVVRRASSTPATARAHARRPRPPRQLVRQRPRLARRAPRRTGRPREARSRAAPR